MLGNLQKQFHSCKMLLLVWHVEFITEELYQLSTSLSVTDLWEYFCMCWKKKSLFLALEGHEIASCKLSRLPFISMNANLHVLGGKLTSYSLFGTIHEVLFPGFVDFKTSSNVSSAWRRLDKDWIFIFWWTYPLNNVMCCFSTKKLALTFLIFICLFVSCFLNQVIPVIPAARAHTSWTDEEQEELHRDQLPSPSATWTGLLSLRGPLRWTWTWASLSSSSSSCVSSCWWRWCAVPRPW